MQLHIVFCFLILIVIISIVFSLRVKHKNLGFVFTSSILIILDILSMLIIYADTIKEARNYLLVYYIFYPWLFLGTFWTVLRSYTKKVHFDCNVGMAIICFIQSAIMASGFFKNGLITFSQEIAFGRIWWVVKMPMLEFGSDAYIAFLGLCLINCIIIFSMMLVFIHNVPKVFKIKYINLSFLQGIMFVLILLTFINNWPVWIHTAFMNFICYLTFYYVFLYSDIKLRDTVLYDFANEMTDGVIIYNKFGDIIHVNDLIKNLVSDDFLRGIQDIEKVDRWITHTEKIENYDVIPYKNGENEYFFSAHKSIIGSEDNAIGTVYTFHDTTSAIKQFKIMEEMNSELERTARMKSDFLANMSHELRTPMNAVIGLTEIALREKDISPELKNCLNQINNSGKNLLNIINDILDFSKIDAGKMEIIPEKYEPLSEVNDITNIMQTRIGDKPISFLFIVDTDIPHELVGDSMRIRQVIINLANNAIKFTDTGMVRIVLTCRMISEDDINLEFHIIDTGRGIKKEDLEKLFVSFQQVDSKRNRNVEGTGLGLAISKKLVEAMGGTIGVSSEYGKGSDFWFTVPQKISNPKKDLIVENASRKFAFNLVENKIRTDEFVKEMKCLGIECKLISDIDQYEPTGKNDYLFFDQNLYTREMEDFLDAHPMMIGVMFTDFKSNIKPNRKNLRLLKKPLSTLAMVLALNGKTIEQMKFKGKESKYVKFTAPNAKVLIVDDNSINLSIAVGLLEPIKCQCYIAQSGFEAIEKLKEEHFDLVLMDHMMPEMDGVETAKAIRHDIPDADDTPIIALTANVMEGSKDLFLKAGMVDMIAKPIDINQLNSKLIKWLPNFMIKEEEPEEEPETSETEELYDCLDCAKAINALGTVSLFKKIVLDYYKAGKENISSIENALTASDWKNYAIKTHSLKSTSRQIGAYELGDLAEKLELAGKAEDENEIRKYHDLAMKMYEKLIDDLSVYFKDEDNSSKPEISEVLLYDIFDNMLRACVDLDMDGMEKCSEQFSDYSYPENKKWIIEKIKDAVSKVDTDEITRLIEEYKK